MTATLIKVCGVTRPDNAADIAAAGADFIGLNFWPSSKRYLPPDHAAPVAEAARAARPDIRVVGVFVNAPLADIVALARSVPLDAIQLHGDETADDVAAATRTGCAVWKAIAVTGARATERLDAWAVDAILLDAPSAGRGGSGHAFDWSLARAVRSATSRRIVLAGGLSPDNVAAAIDAVAPWAVDVASGVEASPGIKDPGKVAAFVAAVHARG